MASYSYKTKSSEWLRYDKQTGLWLRHRKRIYLYWFKFLAEAESSDEYMVDWSMYAGWGGADTVLGVKFDDWWREYWQELFAVYDINNSPRFEPTTDKYKAEAIRLYLLVWQKRHSTDNKRLGNNLAIAREVYRYETGLSGEKAGRKYSEAENLNPDGFIDDYGNVQQRRLQSKIGRYLREANQTLEAVCIGRFPK
jgi:hypothetical protein